MHLSNHITNTDSFSHAAVKATNANNKLHQIYCLAVVVREEAVVVRGEADVVVSNRTNKELVAFGGLSYCHINYMICAMEILHLDSKWSPPEELEAPDQPITNAHPGGVTVALSRAVGLFKWQLWGYVEVFKFGKMFHFAVYISIKSSKSQYRAPSAHIAHLPGQGSGPERIFLSP